LKGKKLSRREMKEDAFVTFAFRALDYVKRHRSKFILGAVAVIAVLAVTTYVSSSRKGAEEDASRQFLAGMLQQRRANYSGAIAAYEDVVSRHSGTASGKLALLYMGHSRYELGQYEQAAEAYEEYLGKERSDKLTRAHAGRGLAACLENTGKYNEAAERYAEVARNLDEGAEVPEDLMFAARCWKLAGTPGKAVELLQEIVDSYPEYQEVEKAKVLLAELQFGSSQ
jgi:TolA-binding protein